MSSVSLADFNPNLLVVSKPIVEKGKNGNNFKKLVMKYNGQTLCLDIPRTHTSGPYYQLPKEGMSGWPQWNISATWADDVPNAKEIKRGLDVVYCAIFKGVAPFGPSIGYPYMQMQTSLAQPDLLDQFNPEMQQLNRDVLAATLPPFYNYPKGENDIRDTSKPQTSYFMVRKSIKSDGETGGLDPYDCPFKLLTKDKEPGIPWKELSNYNLDHTFRLTISECRMVQKLSVRKMVSSSTIYDIKERAGGNAQYVPSEEDKQKASALTPEEQKAFEMLHAKLYGSSSSSASQPQMPPTQPQMPPVQQQMPPVQQQMPPVQQQQMPSLGGGGGVPSMSEAQMREMLAKMNV